MKKLICICITLFFVLLIASCESNTPDSNEELDVYWESFENMPVKTC